MVRLHITTWDGERFAVSDRLDFVPGPEGIIDAELDTEEIAGQLYFQDQPLIVEYQMEGNTVFMESVRISIAESGIPGDFNRDGERTANDLAAFIDAYDHNAPRADRNRDGVVNAADLELFLAEYDAG
jgi:hypothetical protein